MLIKIEFKIKLPVISCFILPIKGFEQFLDVIFDEQGTAKDPHDLEHWSVEFEVMLNDGNEAVCDDGNMYLDSYGIFRSSPKGFDPKMLLDPPEQLDLPSVSVQERDVLCFEIEVVRIVCEGSMQIFRIVDDSPNLRRVVVFVSSSRESDCLVAKYSVSSVKHILTSDNLIFWRSFLPDNEECPTLVNMKESSEVKVASVKDIAGQRLIRKPVHRLEVADIGIGDSVEYGYLCNDVNLSMDFDARLRASEMSPFENGHAKVDGCRVNRIKSPVKFKLLCDPILLGNSHYVECEFLKDTVIPIGVRPRKSRTADWIDAKAKAVRSFCMGSCYINEFPKAFTAGKLAEHQQEKMTPRSRIPVLSSVHILLHNTPEITLRKKACNLSEYVFPYMHVLPNFDSAAKITNSNPGHVFQYLKYCA